MATHFDRVVRSGKKPTYNGLPIRTPSPGSPMQKARLSTAEPTPFVRQIALWSIFFLGAKWALTNFANATFAAFEPVNPSP